MTELQLRTIRLGKTCEGGTFGFSIGPSGRRDHVIARVNKDIAHMLHHGDELVAVNGKATHGVPHENVIQQIISCNAFVELQLRIHPRSMPHRRNPHTHGYHTMKKPDHHGGEEFDNVDHRQQGESALHSRGEGHAAERAEGLAAGNAGGANTATNAFLMMLSEPLESSNEMTSQAVSKFKTVAKVAGKMAILANEPRPQKALQLQKAHDILNIGDRLRSERDAEMKAAKDKAVKEATLDQKKIAAQQFRELRRLLESEAAQASEIQAKEAAAAQERALKNQAAELAQRQALAVRDARDDEIRIKEIEMAEEHALAESRQITAVEKAEQEMEASTMEKCRIRELTAIKMSEKKLWKEAAVKQEMALKAVERQHASKTETLIQQQKTKLSRIQEQCSEEEAAVTALENAVAGLELQLKESSKKYAELERTHQKMLEVVLPNYDANEPWL